MVDTNQPRADGPARVGETTVYTTNDRTSSNRTVADRAVGEPTLGELLTDLSEDFSTLVRQELKLARVETMETVSKTSRSATMMAAGGALAYAGLIVLLLALAVLIGQAIDSYWLGGLLVGLVVLIIGGILISSGRNSLKNVSVAPEKTIETLKDDARWVKEQVK
jgi:uncharacterized membrane protein YqjE